MLIDVHECDIKDISLLDITVGNKVKFGCAFREYWASVGCTGVNQVGRNEVEGAANLL